MDWNWIEWILYAGLLPFIILPAWVYIINFVYTKAKIDAVRDTENKEKEEERQNGEEEKEK